MSLRNYKEIFKKNFLTSVACEIRFTSLLIIKDRIGQFQKQIRNDFPKIARGFTFPKEFEFDEWVFISDDDKNKLKIFTDRLSVITTLYNDFDPFYKMVCDVIKKFFESFKDIDTLKRIGLRYTNAIPLDPEKPLVDILKWFNPLIYENKIEDLTPIGFPVEFRMPKGDNIITCRNRIPIGESPHYFIDIDTYTERNIKKEEFDTIFNELHDLAIEEFYKNIKDEFLNVLRGVE